MSIASNRNFKHTVVSDHRWIHAAELKRGMYVSELDVPWENTTFMFQGFFVESAVDIKAVQQQATYVRVKTEKVARVNTGSYKRMCGSLR